jgi:hypothetical protein
MILIVAALVCVATVPLTGGQLRRLVELRFRYAWAALAALALQVAITTLAPSGPTRLHELLHLASYVLAASCIIANRRIAGLPVLALGAALNATAIAVNDGVMPASARAMRLAGLEPAEHFANSAALANARLLPLGDVIPIPGPWPLGNVLSAGDLLIIAGLLMILHVASRAPQHPRHATARPPRQPAAAAGARP